MASLDIDLLPEICQYLTGGDIAIDRYTNSFQSFDQNFLWSNQKRFKIALVSKELHQSAFYYLTKCNAITLNNCARKDCQIKLLDDPTIEQINCKNEVKKDSWNEVKRYMTSFLNLTSSGEMSISMFSHVKKKFQLNISTVIFCSHLSCYIKQEFTPLFLLQDIKYVKFFDDTLANSMLKCKGEKVSNYDPKESPDDGLNKNQIMKWLVLFIERNLTSLKQIINLPDFALSMLPENLNLEYFSINSIITSLENLPPMKTKTFVFELAKPRRSKLRDNLILSKSILGKHNIEEFYGYLQNDFLIPEDINKEDKEIEKFLYPHLKKLYLECKLNDFDDHDDDEMIGKIFSELIIKFPNLQNLHLKTEYVDNAEGNLVSRSREFIEFVQMLERKLLEMESRKAQLNIKIEINGRIENDEFIPKSKIGDWQSVFRNEKYDLKFNGVDYTTMYNVDINKEINISSTKSITAVCNLLACGPGPDYDEEGNERFAESDDEEMQDSEEDVEENQA